MGLWANDIKIDVLGVTGGYESGKTLFVATIDPPNTLFYDFEKSAATYTGLGFHRRDFPSEMLSKKKTGYTPLDVFNAWRDDIESIEFGKYSVIAVDTISDIESGMVEYVKSQHKNYGFKTSDAFTSMGGVFWGAVKEYWTTVLANLASRCETFGFTAHLRTVYKNNRPTNSQQPMGKETLMKLSSLYLWLDRDAVESGPHKGKKPNCPAANVLKSRLAITVVDAKAGIKIQPLLPPRIPECTPEAIREYLRKPPNWEDLSANERVKERAMTDEDRLIIEADIAENNRVAAESALSRLDRQVELREEERSGRNLKREAAARPAVVSNDMPSAAIPEKAEACPTAPADSKSSGDGSDGISQEQSMKLLEMASKSGVGMKALQFQIEKITGGLDPRKLPAEKAAGMLAWLEKATVEKEKKEAEVAADPKTVSMTVDDIPF
jgi:hypothetical protein